MHSNNLGTCHIVHKRVTYKFTGVVKRVTLTDQPFFSFHSNFFWRENVNENELRNCTHAHIHTYVDVIHFVSNNVRWHFIHSQCTNNLNIYIINMNGANERKRKKEKAHPKHRKHKLNVDMCAKMRAFFALFIESDLKHSMWWFQQKKSRNDNFLLSIPFIQWDRAGKKKNSKEVTHVYVK